MVVGAAGEGWQQVVSELSYERSGPERLLSTFPLLVELVRVLGERPDAGRAAALGRLVAHLAALRRLSLAVADALEDGELPLVPAAVVKDLGTRHEQAIAETARRQRAAEPSIDSESRFERLLAEAILAAPGFTLRGGTNEILRGIAARGLGLR
jgi:hypothetical protein